MSEPLRLQTGERFACLVFSGFDLRFDGIPNPLLLNQGCWTSNELPFSLDEWWREQLGKIVSEQVESYSNFVISAKSSNSTDDEKLLGGRVEWLLWGLAISAGIPQFDLARVISGRVEEGHPRIKIGTAPSLFRSFGFQKPSASHPDFVRALIFAQRVEEIVLRKRQDLKLFWRVISGFRAFRVGVCSTEPEIRLHQFVRTIESFLPPNAFGAEKFAEYGQTLLSGKLSLGLPREMYRLRNKTEHHEHFEGAKLSGPVPADTANRRTRQAETLCREYFVASLSREQSFSIGTAIADRSSVSGLTLLWCRKLGENRLTSTTSAEPVSLRARALALLSCLIT